MYVQVTELNERRKPQSYPIEKSIIVSQDVHKPNAKNMFRFDTATKHARAI
jgi:hypothetical protein